jgi:hypothetical protein
LGKAEDKRAAIIANQAAREKADAPAGADAAAAKPKKMNWAATPPVRPRRGRPPSGFTPR